MAESAKALSEQLTLSRCHSYPKQYRGANSARNLKMLELAKYTEKELLRGGRSIEICAICAADRTELLSALYRSSPQSLYRRFFAPKRGLTEG